MPIQYHPCTVPWMPIQYHPCTVPIPFLSRRSCPTSYTVTCRCASRRLISAISDCGSAKGSASESANEPTERSSLLEQAPAVTDGYGR